MLAGIDRLRPDDAVIIFADADIAPDMDWLARLIRVLGPRRVLDIASGYRWLEPTDDRWSTAFICVMNSSVATVPRRRLWTYAWGGSMALRRQTAEKLDLKTLWRGAVDDDLTLSRAVRARGGYMHATYWFARPRPTSGRMASPSCDDNICLRECTLRACGSLPRAQPPRHSSAGR